jgi:hypothetical protein
VTDSRTNPPAEIKPGQFRLVFDAVLEEGEEPFPMEVTSPGTGRAPLRSSTTRGTTRQIRRLWPRSTAIRSTAGRRG